MFADPPFNLGKDYGHGISDALKDSEYLDWCAAWVAECCRVVAPGGALWAYNLPKWNIEIGHMLNAAGMTFRHWVSIAMTTRLPIAGKLYPAHYSLLYYTKGKPKHFDRPRIPIAACLHCGGDIKDYGGQRKKIHPDGVNLSDVWTDIRPVRHRTTKHRAANALPEKMLERVLSISTGEGDLVADFFGGLGRRTRPLSACTAIGLGRNSGIAPRSLRVSPAARKSKGSCRTEATRVKARPAFSCVPTRTTTASYPQAVGNLW